MWQVFRETIAFACKHLPTGPPVLIICHTDKDPGRDEYTQFLELGTRWGKEERILGLLVTSSGVGPSLFQRRQQYSYVKSLEEECGIRLRTAVIANVSRAKRIVVAISWVLGLPIRMFTPNQFDQACRFLGVDQLDVPVLRSEVRYMQQKLGVKNPLPLR